MNRSVYRHPTVATFECMMEECLHRITISDEATRLASMPTFFSKLCQSPPSSKADLLDRFADDYLELTEDRIWGMLTEAAQGHGPLARLSSALLFRRPVSNRRISTGRQAILEKELKDAGHGEHFAIVDLRSVLYKHTTDTPVFVVGDLRHPDPQDMTERSPLVNAFTGRDDGSFLLVMFENEGEICRIGEAARCLGRARQAGPGLARTHGTDVADGDISADPANDVTRRLKSDR